MTIYAIEPIVIRIDDETRAVAPGEAFECDNATAQSLIDAGYASEEPVTPGGGGTSNYNELTNKPKINGVQLTGNKSSSDLNIGGASDWEHIKNKPENLVSDANYVHTDNNYSDEDKDKLDSIQPGETVTQEWNEQNRSIDMTVGTQTVQQMVLTGIAMKSDIAEAMTDVDNEHFHPVAALPDPADEDPTKRPKDNHEYILIEYEQDGTTIKSETHYLFYGGAYHKKSTGGVSLDGYATEDFVNTKTEKMGEFDVTPIPQGPTGANEINAVTSNKDNEYTRLSYVRQSDGTLPSAISLGVKSGLGEDSFELPTKALVENIQGLPSGGTNGQILARNSMSPDNAEWIDNPIGTHFEVGAEKWYGTYTANGVTYQVYSKLLDIGALPSAAGATQYPHGITGINQILQISGFTNDGFVMNAPRQNAQDNISIYQAQKSGNIVVEVGKDRSSKTGFVMLIYAKNN